MDLCPSFPDSLSIAFPLSLYKRTAESSDEVSLDFKNRIEVFLFFFLFFWIHSIRGGLFLGGEAAKHMAKAG